MKKNLIYVFVTLLLMCVCEKGSAQDYNRIDTTSWEKCQESLLKLESEYGKLSKEMSMCYHYAGGFFCEDTPLYSYEKHFGFSCYEKALDIDKQLYGENSAPVGIGYIELALANRSFLENVKLYIDSALVVLRPIYGEQSHQVAMAYLTLASSYYEQNDDICRVAAQYMINTGREYYYVSDYEEIISNLENSIKYYKLASNIYSKLDEKYKYKLDLIADCINQNEEEIKFYKEELELARKIDE